MNSITQPQILNFDSIIKNKLFSIPDFQRPYSWNSNQRDDLFSDIEILLKNNNKKHFMSTIVCLDTRKIETDGSDQFFRYEIVDGQQRITTLIILLKAIEIKLSKSSNNNYVNEANKLKKILVRGKNTVLLQTNHQSELMLRNYLIQDECPTIKEQKTEAEYNLACAINECIKFCEKFTEKGNLNLLKTIKNGLEFIFYSIYDEKIIYTVFEVLNSRGLPVSSVDKCKSMLMASVYDKYRKKECKDIICSLHEIWKQIYQTIGRKRIKDIEALRFAATLCFGKNNKISQTLSEERSLSLFNEVLDGKIKISDIHESINSKIKNEDSSLLISSLILKISKELLNFEDELDKANTVIDITQARLLFVAIKLSKYNKKQKNELIEKWKKITFRIYGLYHKDSRTSVGDYVRLSRSIFYGMKFKDALKEIEKIGKNYPINKVVTELKGKIWYQDYYNEAKYVLYKYEEYLAKINNENVSYETWQKIWDGSTSETIEHIYPETYSKKLNENWPNKKIKNQDDLNTFVHSIGNLLLLPSGLNSKLGQKSFADKKNEYRRQSMRISDFVVKQRVWTEAKIKSREKEILDFIVIEWK